MMLKMLADIIAGVRELARLIPDLKKMYDQLTNNGAKQASPEREEIEIINQEAQERSSVPLPRTCEKYWSQRGCTRRACQELHLCRLFLAGICKFGDKCRRDHSLDSTHNTMVCNQKGFLVTSETVRKLKQSFAKKHHPPDAFYHRNLELCLRQNSTGSCQNCNRVHICREYVEGTCTRQSNCRFGHNLHSRHNSAVLYRHGASTMGHDDIVRLLLDNARTKGLIEEGDQRGSSSVLRVGGTCACVVVTMLGVCLCIYSDLIVSYVPSVIF